ncbi:hypothetical protein LTR20_009260 [Exophiala xenobiotica]|nr:hypothetical protein LTS13_011042 [Exophiala xenobiotica]KAK5456319.1 hypothetical protein LTR20_009260 [Exophiala xenobiotica]KAK5470176.1 hypothetical protein LTR26_011077 [Exophiala xenobiotica]KAK5480821.1 hypothetical protein LTR83_009893 [Exophiala xenobiotica]KAK5507859.1 hypothetical protein LTR07_011083 [Exophiala xenobiotica]
MAPDKPLPVETLLPFNTNRSPETVSYLQSAQRRESGVDSQSPLSAEEDEGSENEPGKPKRQKRSRACVACRNMKIRCLPVEGQEACNACSRVNRECIMPGPPRKRQKTVHKVAELEKKINALTDALLAKQHTEPSPPHTSPDKEQTANAHSVPSAGEDTSSAGLDPYPLKLTEKPDEGLPPSLDWTSTRSCPVVTNTVLKDDYVDVVEQGMLSKDSATSLFNYWAQNMCESCPMVHFPPGTQAQEVRTRRPMTFLAILAATSSAIMPSIQPSLVTEAARQFSERVLFHGDKSVDLVQALLLHSQYYVRPRTARDLAFHQYAQSASTMCYDLGIGKRSRMRDRTIPPTDHVELARTWIAVYHANISVSTVLRVPAAPRYDAHLEECLQLLENRPSALPGDKWMCAQAKLSRIAQEVSEAFNMCDPGADLNFTDMRTQHQLKYFRRRLDEWEKSVDTTMDHRLVLHQLSCINLYMHEIALHFDHNVDDFRPGQLGYERPGPDTLTSLHIDAFTTLLTGSHKMLDIWLSLDVRCARSLPNLYIVWNAYAVVILIKIHWIVNGPDSKVDSISSADVKTDFYLDAMMNKLTLMSAESHSPCAEAFGFLFKKLKIWHQHRGGMNSDDEQGINDPESRRQRGSQLFGSDSFSFVQSVKNSTEYSRSTPQPPAAYPLPTLPHQRFMMGDGGLHGSNLNAAYDAASYGNTNWEQFNFSTEEMDMFDVYMNNSGWMGYLL